MNIIAVKTFEYKNKMVKVGKQVEADPQDIEKLMEEGKITNVLYEYRTKQHNQPGEAEEAS